jgi:acetylornithine/N-succinyldiaminopimelate aminotransferase
MNTKSIINTFTKYVVPTPARLPAVIMRGKGARVWDADGKEYLDLFSGWGVSTVGYCHPKVAAAIKAQVGKLIHMPNNFYNELQGELAKTISKKSFPGKSFFCNSGAEANETALKLARKYGHDKGKNEVVSMENSFHGRTFGALTATGQVKYQKDFTPVVPGFSYVPFGNFDALKNAVTDKTCAIIMEPIQGEGGINIASKDYFLKVRALCDEKDIVLIFDEVQTGCGRTGKYFAFQYYGVLPDVMTLAKTIGGGFPIGVAIARGKFGDVLQPGNHASTFGGSPLACSAALAVFRAIDEEKMLGNVKKMGTYLVKRLEQLKAKYSYVCDVRGVGLMVGMELEKNGPEIVKKCMEKGLIINCTAGKVIRFLPSLAITKKELDKGISILDDVMSEFAEEG